MTDVRAQSTYQVRLGWGREGLARLAKSGIIVIVDALASDGSADASAISAELLAAAAAALPHEPVVLLGSLRNASATAKAAFDVQVARGGRTAINLVLVGDDGAFAVEDYLAAGAIADALSAVGLDHSSPDAAVATEGFRSLNRAVKHLFSASAAGLGLGAAGRRDEVTAASQHDADAEAIRFE